MSGSVALSTVESGKKRFPDYAEGMDAETLVFFLTVVETQSLPRAADQLGVSLSSANRMLAKLRRYWDEPLFVRSGFQMMPTESARRRVAGVRSILKTLEVLQSPEAVISPETIRTTVRIAAYDNACAVGIASVLDDFQAKLPQVTFQVFQADGHFFEDLIAGRLDLVFYARQGLAPGLHSMPMFTTPYVIVTVKGHPLEKRVAKKGALEREDLAPYRQVLVNTQPDRYRAPNGPANGWFNPTDLDKVVAVLPFFLAAPLCLVGTDHYAVTPKAAAKLFVDETKFSLLPLTDKAPQLTTHLAWHDRWHDDPAAQLIRSTMKVLISERVRELLGTEKESLPQEK